MFSRVSTVDGVDCVSASCGSIRQSVKMISGGNESWPKERRRRGIEEKGRTGDRIRRV